jgi:hypothetical protein
VGAGSPNNPSYEVFDPMNQFVKKLPSFPVDPSYLARVKQVREGAVIE